MGNPGVFNSLMEMQYTVFSAGESEDVVKSNRSVEFAPEPGKPQRTSSKGTTSCVAVGIKIGQTRLE